MRKKFTILGWSILILSLLSLIAVIVIFTVNNKNEANKSMVDFSDVRLLTIDDLESMNPDEPVEYRLNENKKIMSITGTCAEFKIYNSEDALKAIFALQNILTVCDIDNLRLYEEHHDKYTDVYEFEQYVNGVRVYDGVVTVRVYTDTMEAFVVSSTIDSTITIDTQNKISKEKAVRILKDQDKFKDIEIVSAELVIYGNRLSWNFEITHSDISFIIMDANTGDILNVAYIEAIAKN